MIDLVVVNWKTYPLIQDFIDSYNEFKPKHPSRIILVDNESDPDGLATLRDTDDVTVIAASENHGYAKACNAGAAIGDSEYIGFLNSDTRFVDDKCVDTLVAFMEANPTVANVGPLQYSSEGKITHGGILGKPTKPEHRGWGSKDKDAVRDNVRAVTVSGSAFFTKRSVWDEMAACPFYNQMFPIKGAFPPFKHFYEETLYAYHVTAHGYYNYYIGEAEMVHEWHQSSPVGSQDHNFYDGQKQFRAFCDSHGIDHD